MRILVLGAHGWVGKELVAELGRRRFSVVAPRHQELDIADEEAVERFLWREEPDAIVNAAAANTRIVDEAVLRAVNVDGAQNVAAVAVRTGARLVHVSTDLVLDGRSPPYRDDAAACPVTPYGRSKAAGEAAVLGACPAAVVVRASHVFDASAPDATLRDFIERLERGEPVRLFVDEFRCPIARPLLASALAELVLLDVSGTLNVAGAERVSRFEYGTLLLRHFGIDDRGLVERARAADLRDPRPLDLDLDTSKARSLLATPLVGVREALSRAG